MRKWIETAALWGVILAVVFGLLAWRGAGETYLAVSGEAAGEDGAAFIVIDSGHGFFDAGKTGINGAEEKTINLAIAQKLRCNLEQMGYRVKLTREDDDVLYDGSRPESKQEDMQKRVALMNAQGCLLAVSIHQNSFGEAKYKGAQVFYYTGSEESSQLAALIQQSMIERLDPDNTRQEKANGDYYLLKKSTVPVVICECGFLSNEQEAALLVTEAYQEKTAWAVAMGIAQYLNGAGGEDTGR